MRKIISFLFLLILQSCGTSDEPVDHPVDQSPPFIDLDGTYIMDVKVHTVPMKGPAEDIDYGFQEVVVDYREGSNSVVWMKEAVGVTEKDQITFGSKQYRRNPFGPGKSTNYFKIQFSGSADEDSAEVIVIKEIFADGELIDSETSTWTFSQYFKSF